MGKLGTKKNKVGGPSVGLKTFKKKKSKIELKTFKGRKPLATPKPPKDK